MTCLNEILGKGTTWMRACGITSHFLFRMAKEQSASARPRGARSLLLSLHPLRVCHFCVKVHSLLSKFEPCPLTISLILKTVKNDNLFERIRRWHLPHQEWFFFSSFSFFRRRKMRERNQKRHLFFSLFRLFHRRVFGGRWRNEMVFFSLFFLKIPLFKGFFRAVAVLFSYKRAGGKVVFLHFVQGVRVQKKPHAAGIRSTRLRCLLWYFFSFFPQLSPIQTLSGSVILRINGSGKGHSIFALQRKYTIALILGQETLADEPIYCSLTCATGSFISRCLLFKLEF